MKIYCKLKSGTLYPMENVYTICGVMRYTPLVYF